MVAMDSRMNYTNEAITNVKALKLYSWTDVFEEEIKRRREIQIDEIKRKAWWTVAMVTSTQFFPNIVTSVSFTTYIGTGGVINLANAFTVLVFFNMIRDPLRAFPDFITLVIDMIVSMKRI